MRTKEATPDELGFKGFRFDCEISVAINPITYSEVKLTPPVKIRDWAEFMKFNDQWEQFCKDLRDIGIRDPKEVHFKIK